MEEAQKRAEKLHDHIRTSEQQMEEQQKILNDLQGDVGSGKTIVAFLAMLQAVESGAQPSESLTRKRSERETCRWKRKSFQVKTNPSSPTGIL